jgi:hypothetical protein
MPTTTHIQRLVGEALAAALSDYEFSGDIKSIDATWRRIPDYQLEDLGTLKCSVTPGPVTVNSNDAPRRCDFFEPVVGISIAKHVGSESEIQQLEDLNMEIIDAIRSYLIVLNGLPAACDWTDIALPMPFDRDALTDRNVFFSQIEVTYRVPMDKVTPS